MRLPQRLLAVLSFCLGGVLFSADAPALKPTVFAITNARVFAEAGKVLPKATVVVRDGLIEAVGPDVKAPADAVVIDGEHLTVYPGFVDGLSNWGYDHALRRSEGGPPAPEDFASEALAATKPDNRKGMTPEFAVRTALKAEEEQAENWRKIGFTAHLVAPDGGLLVGQSSLVSLSGATPRDALLRGTVAQHAALRTPTGNGYPRSLMGAIAHTRQTLLDAQHYQQVWAHFEKRGGVGKRPPLDPTLTALVEVLNGKLPVVFEADSRDEIHRALDFAAEFKLKPILYGGRDAWQAVERLKAQQVPVILRLHFVEQATSRLGRRTSGPFYESSQDADNAPPKRVKDDQQRQLKEEIANAGKLHKAGIVFAFSTQSQPGDKPWEKFRESLRKAIGEGLPAEAALAALTADAAKILGADRQLGSVAAGKAAHLVVTDGDFHEAKTQVCHVFADGGHFEYAKPGKPEPKKTEEKDKAKEKEKDKDKAKGKDKEKTPADTKKPDEPKREQVTELESDRKPKTRTGGNVLIRGATVLTVTNGTQEKTDILVRGGKIEKVEARQAPPDGVAVIDADGLFVMPGIIDTHCHFAMAGGVNEFSLSVVPEVRVRDVIASEDVQIYRGLAGGVTTSRLLHGSANCIGGQDAVVKMKYGEPASKLLMADAPRGVKFALGENVKRTDGRFPNTRLGVEAVFIRAFIEAQEYQRGWDEYRKALTMVDPGGLAPPAPRRDLRLEALADILKGDLKVHCHCYRSDEILMLLRVANRFGFKVKSLQHVLEGYKVAPEIAAHGASCSSFADWWAYKIEAYDAIPFNPALLHEAGATVCLKSDSNELMRHLYQEAAKGVKYGGMSENEALKMITLNGAKQLGLEKRLGSIEVGKDADFAIFNGHPLNSYACVEMTLVEGEVYFQRSEKRTPLAAAKAAPTVPAKEEFKPIPRGKRYVITNATIHPVSGPVIEKGSVEISGGKIVAVVPTATDTTPSQTNPWVVIDGKGLHVYPGMIDAATVLGLTELGSARETHDFSEGGDFQPDLRASTGINPDSELIPVTRANGVLAVVTRPIGSVVAGQSALINLAGWVPSEMAIVDPLALNVEFPAAMPMFTGDPTAPMLGRAIAKKQREEKIKRLKELFRMALVHDAARKANSHYPANPRLEALIPYAQGKKRVVIQANRKPEILEALKLAEELKLKIILSGAIDAWKATDELKKHNVPVILGQVMTMPQEPYDPFDAPFACAAKLHEGGVRFCIRSSGGSNTRNLPYEAAMAVSYGLPPEEGLKAVTLYPARILGVEKQLGSIEGGKRANLVLADGDILQASTRIKALFIDGRPLEPSSKHTKLYERYRERLREVKEGVAPLGTK